MRVVEHDASQLLSMAILGEDATQTLHSFMTHIYT
jgi:hypothetical protein